MLHLKGLDNHQREAAFPKSRVFGSCAGIRNGRRKSGVKPPHSKMSHRAVAIGRIYGENGELEFAMPQINKAAKKPPQSERIYTFTWK